jgi:DNA-binding CsgD family transcriptional regulator
MKFLLLLVVPIFIGIAVKGQTAQLPVNNWIKRLSDPNDKKNEGSARLFESFKLDKDTVGRNSLLLQLQAGGNNSDPYFTTRFKIFHASILTHKDQVRGDQASKTPVLQLLKEAMREANETNDEYLGAYASRRYFLLAMFYGETELAVMYGIYSAELYEKLFGSGAFAYYQFLGELMWRVKEYEKCKDYSSKWLVIEAGSTDLSIMKYRMRVYNTIALAYHRTDQYDSAMYYYNKGLKEAEHYQFTEWEGIIAGNIGQVFYLQKQYDTAIALLDKNYRISNKYKLWDDALNSLQWSARAYAAKGDGTKAMQQLRASMALLELVPEQSYRRNIYAAAVEVFKVNGLFDSAVHYSIMYQKLYDSIERKIATSSLAISNVRLSQEKNMYHVHRLQQDKKTQRQQRNFVILGIALVAVISLLLVNRQRVRYKYRKESLEKEKQIVESEMAAAKQQMEMFTRNIIEKSNLIEKLEQQMRDNTASAGQQEIIGVLTNLTILTEQHWNQFKELFEKIYPMFFQRLKTTAPDISLAEQRMAALTRLRLTARQMASMQGISPDSVHKTRQRLRLRLGISNEANLDEYLANL